MSTWGVGAINPLTQQPTLLSDQVFQQWFWFGIGNTAEQPLNSLSLVGAGQGQTADTILLSYGEQLFGDPIRVDVGYVLISANSTTATIIETVQITNLTGAPLDLHWFELSNFDLEGGAADDSAEVTAGSIHQTDPNGSFIDVSSSPAPNRFQIDAAPNIVNSLNDTAATTLSDTQSPFGPADLEHAFQWDFTLGFQPGVDDSVMIQKTKAGTFTQPAAIETDHFPESTAMLQLQLPDLSMIPVALKGPSTVQVMFEGTLEGDANDTDSNLREEVPTELLSLNLLGITPLGGAVFFSNSRTVASSGQIEESTNNTTGTLDVPPFTPAGTATSSFDVFFDVFVQLDPMQPGIDLHNIACVACGPSGGRLWNLSQNVATMVDTLQEQRP